MRPHSTDNTEADALARVRDGVTTAIDAVLAKWQAGEASGVTAVVRALVDGIGTCAHLDDLFE